MNKTSPPFFLFLFFFFFFFFFFLFPFFFFFLFFCELSTISRHCASHRNDFLSLLDFLDFLISGLLDFLFLDFLMS